MKKIRLTLPVLLCLLSMGATAADLSGDWEIASSVGGEIPITVNCSIEQNGGELTGTCTPVMDNAEAAELTGTYDDASAEWGYEVVFNGNPGTVNFSADEISDTVMSGELNLSGTTAPFTAAKKE